MASLKSVGKKPDVAALGDDTSEFGGMFQEEPAVGAAGVAAPAGGGQAARGGRGLPAAGLTQRVTPLGGYGLGRGPVGPDPRKIRYDKDRARVQGRLAFGASKADRMDAAEAGEVLHRIHVMVGIDRAEENVIAAFDSALFFEHTINGASMLQPGRGVLAVGDTSFQLGPIKTLLGVDQRRFFRAFADEVADVNREVLASFDEYDPGAVEKHAQLVQVAVERGMQKYPYLAHDSADACMRISFEERQAVIASKRLVIPSSVNQVDKLTERVANAQV